MWTGSRSASIRTKAISTGCLVTLYRHCMVTAHTHVDEAAQLRNAMVDRFTLPPGRVDRAMRTVPRHMFLPHVSLSKAYDNEVIVTHRDARGAVLSCSTLPSCTAGMLDELDVQPGHRVLEIGAGTGYNAALLAQLAGADGQVTTIDIDPDVVMHARQHLAAAGFDTVRVLCGDGALGDIAGAPYDRIIVTAGAWDIPSAWTDQAAPAARLVVPLRISDFTHEVTLERGQGPGALWHSTSHHLSGFVPMRGGQNHYESDELIVDNGRAELRLEVNAPVDLSALRDAVRQPPQLTWIGVAVTDLRLPELEIWLASLGGLCRLINRKPGHGLAPTIGEGGSLAVVAEDSVAYFTVDHESSGPAYDLGIYAYGSQSDALTERVAGRVRAWAAEYRAGHTQIEVYHGAAAVPVSSDVLLDVVKRDTRIVVRARPAAA